MSKIRRSPKETEQAFREAVAKLGGTVLGEYIKSHVPIPCQCRNGHISHPRPHNVLKSGKMCPTCGHLVRARRQSEAAGTSERFRTLVLGFGGVVVGTYFNAHTPVECVCAEGHNCAPTLHDLDKGQGLCKPCADRTGGLLRIELRGTKRRFNQIIKEFGGTVLGPYVDNHTKIECICPKGHTCYSKPMSVVRGINMCSQCNVEFNRVYIMEGTFNGKRFCKVGVSSNDFRVKMHIYRGWTRVLHEFELSHEFALSLESKIKKYIKKNNILQLSKADCPDGYTETFSASFLPKILKILDEEVDNHD